MPSCVTRAGHPASKSVVNGNMFAGTFGADVFVRLDERSRSELLSISGSKPFEPMKGLPMRDYVQMPRQWLGAQSDARAWVARALRWTADLPSKVRKPKTATPSQRGRSALAFDSSSQKDVSFLDDFGHLRWKSAKGSCPCAVSTGRDT